MLEGVVFLEQGVVVLWVDTVRLSFAAGAGCLLCGLGRRFRGTVGGRHLSRFMAFVHASNIFS